MAMIRHLYLVRHAKAFDQTIHQSDIDRALTLQGKRDAEKVGMLLKSKHLKIDILYCSPALRTQTTARIILQSSDLKIQTLKIEPVVYQASSTELLHLISKTPNTYQHVALVGHNPAISAFANNLLPATVGGFAPATLAVIQFNIVNWSEIERSKGQLEFIHSPSIF
jgi:phosphohistidine phosphatase